MHADCSLARHMSVPVQFLCFCAKQCERVPDKERPRALSRSLFLYQCQPEPFVCVTSFLLNRSSEGWQTGCFKTSVPGGSCWTAATKKKKPVQLWVEPRQRWWICWTASCCSNQTTNWLTWYLFLFSLLCSCHSLAFFIITCPEKTKGFLSGLSVLNKRKEMESKSLYFFQGHWRRNPHLHHCPLFLIALCLK